MSFDYSKAKFEDVSCNLCGSNDFYALARRSGNNLPQNVSLCRKCGLIYLNPRMTKEEYDNYYKYFYRDDRKQIKGAHSRARTPEEGFYSAQRFGRTLGERLKGHMNERGATIDVGSNTGGILAGLKKVFPHIEVIGIEPSIDAVQFANEKGVTTYNVLFENFDKNTVGSGVSNILCMQTLNHLLDPRSFFEWSFHTLKPGGTLILSVKNFRDQARRGGSVESAVQIDHAYMFTPEMLRLFVEAVGFRVRYEDIDEYKEKSELDAQRKTGLSIHHIRLVAEKPTKEAHPIKNISRSDIYIKMRFQLYNPCVRLYYFLRYARKTKFLHPFFGFLRKW